MQDLGRCQDRSFFVYCNDKININIHCDDLKLKMLFNVADIFALSSIILT